MKLKYIDSLRGLAVLGVLMVHCSLNEIYPKLISGIFANGARGVQLFYLASAFTLFLSMSKRYENEKYPKFNFFIRRFFRIAPMYYLGILYYIWQDGIGSTNFMVESNQITLSNVLSNIFFVHGFSPYWINSLVPGGWSIAVEMLFYCIVPLLFIKIKNTNQAFNFLIFTIFFRCILEFLFQKLQIITIGSEQLWNEYIYYYLPSQLPIFALGILLFFIIKENYAFTVSPKLIIVFSFILLGQFVGIPILTNHILFGIAFLTLGLGLSKFEFRLLVNPLTIYIGKISYSMYLVHFAILFWLKRFDFYNYIQVSNDFTNILNFLIRLSILIVITIIISSATYKFIELPMQIVGKNLLNKLNK